MSEQVIPLPARPMTDEELRAMRRQEEAERERKYAEERAYFQDISRRHPGPEMLLPLVLGGITYAVLPERVGDINRIYMAVGVAAAVAFLRRGEVPAAPAPAPVPALEELRMMAERLPEFKTGIMADMRQQHEREQQEMIVQRAREQAAQERERAARVQEARRVPQTSYLDKKYVPQSQRGSSITGGGSSVQLVSSGPTQKISRPSFTVKV